MSKILTPVVINTVTVGQQYALKVFLNDQNVNNAIVHACILHM